MVRTWSVAGEREAVEVPYRRAMDMAKKVKRNADRTGDSNPSFKRAKREVRAVDDWMQVMQRKDWLSSEYVVGPIRSSNPGRGDGTAEMTVNGDEAVPVRRRQGGLDGPSSQEGSREDVVA